MSLCIQPDDFLITPNKTYTDDEKQALEESAVRMGRNSQLLHLEKQRKREEHVTITQIQSKSNRRKLEGFIAMSNSDTSSTLEIIDKYIMELEESRDYSQTWIRIDMDCYYASAEVRIRPELRNECVAVGNKNMIIASNYAARKFGVKCGSPLFLARQMCPDLIYLRSDMDYYRAVSHQVMKIFEEYDYYFESHGLDEANLNVTEVLNARNMNHPEGRQALALEIRNRVYREVGCSCSAGIACNKLLSKMCTDINKPNGQYYLPFEREAIFNFMKNIPVGKVHGIGSVMTGALTGMNIKTCQDIIDNRLTLCYSFSKCSFEFLMHTALGIGKNYHNEMVIE